MDLDTGKAEPLAEMTLESAGLRERDDLQRWVAERPEIVASGLWLVTTEFDRWELRERRVLDRLDVLFLDTSGSLVVGELKRDAASDTAELQALKYAAYCSSLTVDEVIEEYARYHNLDDVQAREQIFEHAPSLEDDELGPVRVRLVAGGFGPSVTSVVLWLRDHDIDIGCVQITARRHSEKGAVVSARQLIPLPEAEDYLVRRLSPLADVSRPPSGVALLSEREPDLIGNAATGAIEHHERFRVRWRHGPADSSRDRATNDRARCCPANVAIERTARELRKEPCVR